MSYSNGDGGQNILAQESPGPSMIRGPGTQVSTTLTEWL